MQNVHSFLDGFLSYLEFSSVIVRILIFLFLILLITVLLAAVAYAAARFGQAPQITVPACVTAKRRAVTDDPAQTAYYATFALQSGECTELRLPRRYYAKIAEGDSGMLTCRGTRFIRFTR